MAFISLLWQAGLSQVLLRPHQEDIQDWICILSFFLIKAPDHSPSWSRSNTAATGTRFHGHIAELEARSHLPNNPISAPAAVTETPLSSGRNMTSEPGLSNSSQHPQSMCWKEKSSWSSERTVLRWKTLVPSPAQSRTGLPEIQSEQCYRTEYAFPSCSDWSTAKGLSEQQVANHQLFSLAFWG